jgi:hypothetical protein
VKTIIAEEMTLLKVPEALVEALLKMFSGQATAGDLFSALLRGKL